MQKGIALATCMAIVMGLLTGCGNKNDMQIQTSPEEAQKGRYVETELSLPEEWKDKNISQIFRSGDELHFLVAGGAEGQVSLIPLRITNEVAPSLTIANTFSPMAKIFTPLYLPRSGRMFDTSSLCHSKESASSLCTRISTL